MVNPYVDIYKASETLLAEALQTTVPHHFVYTHTNVATWKKLIYAHFFEVFAESVIFYYWCTFYFSREVEPRYLRYRRFSELWIFVELSNRDTNYALKQELHCQVGELTILWGVIYTPFCIYFIVFFHVIKQDSIWILNYYPRFYAMFMLHRALMHLRCCYDPKPNLRQTFKQILIDVDAYFEFFLSERIVKWLRICRVWSFLLYSITK